MIRTVKTKQVDAIITSDWHLREDRPICRTDDFVTEQWKCVDFISDLQKEHHCPALHAGDLFHHWKPSPALLSETMIHLPKNFRTVYGNHDVPQHNLELADKCGVYTLGTAGFLKVIEDGHWNTIPEKPALTIGLDFKRTALVWHIFTYEGKEPWPGCEAPKGNKLLKKYPDYDLIVTGDNHIPFTAEYEGRLLVNPGALTRQTAAQIDFEPRVYLWHAEDNTVTPVYLPIAEGVISRSHIEQTEKRNDRIDAFISTLKDNYKVGMSFEDNLKAFEKKNNIKDEIMEIVYKSIDV